MALRMIKNKTLATYLACFLLGAGVTYAFFVLSTTVSNDSKNVMQNADGNAQVAISTTNIIPEFVEASAELYEEELTPNDGAQTAYRFVDLNNDGQAEIMARFTSTYSCGASNCQSKFYEQKDDTYAEIFSASIKDFPKVLASSTDDYSDLQFGPDARDRVSIWKWDGEKYQYDSTHIEQ